MNTRIKRRMIESHVDPEEMQEDWSQNSYHEWSE